MKSVLWTSRALLGMVMFALLAAGAEGAQPVNHIRALIIGSSSYPDAMSLSALPGADHEARRIKQMLLDMHVPESGIILLTSDHPHSSYRPTRSNIDYYVEWLQNNTAEDQLLLIMFTGHGIGTNQASFLCPMDSTDAAIAAPSADRLVGVSELAQKMSTSRAKRKLLVVDACRNLTSGANFVGGLKKPAPGVWIMSSCSQGQVAAMDAQSGKAPQSIFWSSFEQSFRGNADLLGNNSGSISLFELYTCAYVETQKKARELQITQTPELFGGVSMPFDVVAISSHVQAPHLRSSDVKLESKQAAKVLANSGIEHARGSDVEFAAQFRVHSHSQMALADWVYADHHNRLSYALSNYLEPALEIDPESRLARLGQGWVYRSCGLYSEALAAYRSAGERLDVYVKGEQRARSTFLSQNEQSEGHLVFGHTESGLELKEVILRETPDSSSEEITRVKAHSKVTIERIEGVDPEQQWLLVSHMNDNPLKKAAWIPRNAVHWFAEAADVYTPASPLGESGGASGISRLSEAASSLETVAERVDMAAERVDGPANALNAAAARLRDSAPARIAGRLGFSLPGIGYVEQAASYASIPGSYMRRGSSYLRVPAQYTNVANGWAGAAEAYFDGQDRVTATEEKRLKLRLVQPVRRKEIELINAPWEL